VNPSGRIQEPPFRLEAPPNELWSRKRMASEFGVTEATITRWAQSGQIPRPWTRRRGRPLWAPETIGPALRRHLRCPDQG
jgi:hypothetical protein